MIAGLRLSWDICRRIIHTLILNCPASIACRDPDQAASIGICEESGRYPELTGYVSYAAYILICKAQYLSLNILTNELSRLYLLIWAINLYLGLWAIYLGPVSYPTCVWMCELCILPVSGSVSFLACIWICELCIRPVSRSVSWVSCLYLDLWVVYPSCIYIVSCVSGLYLAHEMCIQPVSGSVSCVFGLYLDLWAV